MKIAELMMNIHRKDFNMEKELQVKKYLPFELKRALAQKITEECAIENDGVLKIDSVKRYLSYVRYMITSHTNLQYTDKDYDTLCSTTYHDSTLLNAIMKCFEGDATECSRILNLVTDDFVREHSIENVVSKFLHNLNNSLDTITSNLGEKINSFDIKTLLPQDFDGEKMNKFLQQYIK